MPEKPVYQADVKRPLKPAGKLIVYQDRTEFITSSVQKTTFHYAGLVSVRKGLLDNIEFVTEDGHVETCPADRKCVHEALVYIEQASMPYRTQRKERLLSQGIRYSFPSNQGLMNSGVLNLSADRAEFMAKSGKNDVVSYQDVKSVSASGGMLNLVLFGGGSRSFAVSRELLDEVSSFVSASVAPYLAQRKEVLLAQGIYFSSDSPDGGTLDILSDRAEKKSRSGQVEDCVLFPDIREIGLYGGVLEFALTDGTSKSFAVEEYLSADILAFVKKAIEPYVAARTVGFDTAFGTDEQIEFNGERGVFHLIRQGGKEITGEWPAEDLLRCELWEDKKLTALGSMVSGGIGLIKNAAKAAGNQAGVAPAAEEKIGGVVVTLTIRTGEGAESQCVCLGRSPVGMGRTDRKYSQCMADWAALSEYLKAQCPGCELAEPAIPEPELTLPEAGETSDRGDAAPAGAEEAPEAEEAPAGSETAVRRDDFGLSGYIEGVSRFIKTCSTPMTIALQGNRGSGKNSVLGVLFDQMSDSYGKDLFWINTRQLAKGESPEVVGNALIGLLSGGDNQTGSFLTGLAGLATGIVAGDSAIGKELVGGMLNKNAVSSQMDAVEAFSKRIEEKAREGSGKVVFFVDGLDQLSPAKAVDLLETMRDFFECKGCVFVVSANYSDILRGAQERYDKNKARSFFDSMFKMTFRVPASSINVKNYAKGKLEDMGIQIEEDGELELYAALIQSSIGKNMEAMDRLFVSFHLLKDLSGGEVCADENKRLTLFALLCMQTRFRDAYGYAMQRRDNVTPEFLSGLCGASDQPWNRDQTEDEIAAYREFGAVLAQIIDLDGREEISEVECKTFAAALELSSITSR